MSRRFSDLQLRLKTRRGISRSNLGRRSRCGRLTATPAGDGDGATAATLARQPEGYDEPSSMRSSSMGAGRDSEFTLGDLGRRRR
jgi:hypothetical protein